MENPKWGTRRKRRQGRQRLRDQHDDNQVNQFNLLDTEDDVMDDAFTTTTTNKLFNGETPWAASPPNADDSIFHTTALTAAAPMSRSFTGTLETGFTVTSTDKVNFSKKLKLVLPFALKTDKDLRIQPLLGGDQSIAWPNGIPGTKEGIDLYFKHKVVKDGVRVNINVTMSK
jgi:hypothetical protein